MKKVFFSNSGAESNECAIKVARKYSAEKKGADCYTIVTLINSFHGRTITTLAATGQDVFHNYFYPFTDGFVYTPANDKEALEKALAEVYDVAEYIHDIADIAEDNPTGNLMAGKLRFRQKLGFWVPAREIENIIEIDAELLRDALGGE